MMKERRSKIFGIGLSKTGTTSLAGALTMLGYRTRDYIGVTRYMPNDLSCLSAEELDANDAFTDTPIPSLYRELDAAYPHSKFILTVRDADGWLRSCKKQFTVRNAEKQNAATRQVTMELYGCVSYDEKKFLAGYIRHVEGVKAYFQDRPQDLLVLDLCGGQGWLELCAFLDKPVPDVPFPTSNVTEIEWLRIESIVALAQQAGGKAVSGLIERLALPVDGWARLAKDAATGDRDDNNVKYGFVARLARAHITRAAKAANALIAERLSKLTPATPVLITSDKEMPYSERSKWSYFWLVSSFDEAIGNAEELGPLTISITLVERRKPKLGVVYVPSKETTYYSNGRSGSFKVGREGTPISLSTTEISTSLVLANRSELTSVGRDCLPSDQHSYRVVAEGVASALCAVAEGRGSTYIHEGSIGEARVAAGHAVLRGVGKILIDCDSRTELEYNKDDLEHGSFRVA